MFALLKRLFSTKNKLEEKETLEPEDVFTPYSFPLGENNVYVNRGDAEKNLIESIRESSIPLVYGQYGVGKTTLVKSVVNSLGAKTINIPSADKLTKESLIDTCLKELGVQVSDTTDSLTGTIGVAGTNVGTTRSIKKTDAVKGTTEVEFLNILDKHKVFLIIDEVHKASSSFKEDLANFLKSYKNHGSKTSRILLIGTSNTASELLALDEGISRYIRETEVGLMTTDESKRLLEEGLRKLEIKIDPEILGEIIDYSCGVPTYVQLFGLYSVRYTREHQLKSITKEAYDYAINKYVTEKATRLNDHYRQAIETTGPFKYRQKILWAISKSDKTYVTMDEIRERVSGYLDRAVKAENLSGPLRELKGDNCGRILRDFTPIKGAVQRINSHTFSDPMMKAFVRLKQKVESQTTKGTL